VVILTNGKYAGRKAVIIQNFDQGDKANKFKYGNAIVAGVFHYPKKVTKKMSVKNVQKRSHLKPFIKRVNYAHILPTRYLLADVDVKKLGSEESLQPSNREGAIQTIKKEFEAKYISGKNRWFFSKLRF